MQGSHCLVSYFGARQHYCKILPSAKFKFADILQIQIDFRSVTFLSKHKMNRSVIVSYLLLLAYFNQFPGLAIF